MADNNEQATSDQGDQGESHKFESDAVIPTESIRATEQAVWFALRFNSGRIRRRKGRRGQQQLTLNRA